jgi:hypothetical protein
MADVVNNEHTNVVIYMNVEVNAKYQHLGKVLDMIKHMTLDERVDILFRYFGRLYTKGLDGDNNQLITYKQFELLITTLVEKYKKFTENIGNNKWFGQSTRAHYGQDFGTADLNAVYANLCETRWHEYQNKQKLYFNVEHYEIIKFSIINELLAIIDTQHMLEPTGYYDAAKLLLSNNMHEIAVVLLDKIKLDQTLMDIYITNILPDKSDKYNNGTTTYEMILDKFTEQYINPTSDQMSQIIMKGYFINYDKIGEIINKNKYIELTTKHVAMKLYEIQQLEAIIGPEHHELFKLTLFRNSQVLSKGEFNRYKKKYNFKYDLECMRAYCENKKDNAITNYKYLISLGVKPDKDCLISLLPKLVKRLPKTVKTALDLAK